GSLSRRHSQTKHLPARTAPDAQMPAMLRDDAVRDREPKTGAAADGLGAEERLEHVRQRVLRNAGTIIDYLGVHHAPVAAHGRVQNDASTGLALEHRLLGIQ